MLEPGMGTTYPPVVELARPSRMLTPLRYEGVDRKLARAQTPRGPTINTIWLMAP